MFLLVTWAMLWATHSNLVFVFGDTTLQVRWDFEENIRHFSSNIHPFCSIWLVASLVLYFALAKYASPYLAEYTRDSMPWLIEIM